jgi:hypothetical protein
MMAVIFFCLRPLFPSERNSLAHRSATAIRQPESYMWMQPSEYPQGLGTLYVSNLLKGKEKVGGTQKNGGKLFFAEVTSDLAEVYSMDL